MARKLNGPCRICSDVTPHIHTDRPDDPHGDAVPIAVFDARTTPCPIPLASQKTGRLVMVAFGSDEVVVDAGEIDEALEAAFGWRR